MIPDHTHPWLANGAHAATYAPEPNRQAIVGEHLGLLMCDKLSDALLREYYEIHKVVGEFDGRLLTVKGWGVTLSLAALAWGFEKQKYGPFWWLH